MRAKRRCCDYMDDVAEVYRYLKARGPQHVFEHVNGALADGDRRMSLDEVKQFIAQYAPGGWFERDHLRGGACPTPQAERHWSPPRTGNTLRGWHVSATKLHVEFRFGAEVVAFDTGEVHGFALLAEILKAAPDHIPAVVLNDRATGSATSADPIVAQGFAGDGFGDQPERADYASRETTHTCDVADLAGDDDAECTRKSLSGLRASLRASRDEAQEELCTAQEAERLALAGALFAREEAENRLADIDAQLRRTEDVLNQLRREADSGKAGDARRLVHRLVSLALEAICKKHVRLYKHFHGAFHLYRTCWYGEGLLWVPQWKVDLVADVRSRHKGKYPRPKPRSKRQRASK